MERIIKEYDNQAAIAGAPVACRDERYTPDILKRTGDGIFGTISSYGGPEQPMRWNTNGMVHVSIHGPLDLVMEPLGVCEGRPVWHGDALMVKDSGRAVHASGLHSDFRGYAWPEDKPKWPITTASADSLREVWLKAPGESWDTCLSGFVAVANAAIAHECEAGNLIPREIVRGMLLRAVDTSNGCPHLTRGQKEALASTFLAAG